MRLRRPSAPAEAVAARTLRRVGDEGFSDMLVLLGSEGRRKRGEAQKIVLWVGVSPAGGTPRSLGSHLSCHAGWRNDRNAARISAVKSPGCSQAAKWPPLSSLL